MSALLERQRARYFRVVTSRVGGGVPLDMALQVERFSREMAADGVSAEDALDICEMVARDAAAWAKGRVRPQHRKAVAPLARRISPNLAKATNMALLELAALPAPDADPCSVYLASGRSGMLLYVGVADVPARRFRQHERDSPWWPLAARIEMEQYEKRSKALEREAELDSHARTPVQRSAQSRAPDDHAGPSGRSAGGGAT